MHKYFSYIIILAVIILTGCSPTPPNGSDGETEVQQLSGFTTISGIVRAQSSANANIETTSGIIPVETLSVDFTEFDGQAVSATGKYSGDTLFISEIELTQ